jgi:hypothetical protein
MVGGESLASSFAIYRQWPDLARTPMDALHWASGSGPDQTDEQIQHAAIPITVAPGIA